MRYRCKRFKLHELVYPELYHHYKGSSKLWSLFDVRLLVSIDLIAEFLDIPVIINNWAFEKPGVFKESGLRKHATTTGAVGSAHKIGKAADLKFESPKWNPEKLREYMKSIGAFEPGFLQRTDAEAMPFLNIRRIEWINHMNWFHMDTAVFEVATIDSGITIPKVPTAITIVRG